MNFAFRILLTVNATAFLPVIFLVSKDHALFSLSFSCSLVVYFSLPILLTWVTIRLSSYLGKDSFEKGSVDSVRYANHKFLPSYLAYFFVALSIENWTTFTVVYFVLFIFTYLSQAFYFNPLFFLFGFRFYDLVTNQKAAIFLISRQDYKIPDNVRIENAYRINDYTFIERR